MVLQDRKANCHDVSHLLLYLPTKVVELAMLHHKEPFQAIFSMEQVTIPT